MSVTAGALSKVTIGQTTASLLSAAATGGTGPYTYQWYMSLTPGFTPGAGNLVAGATALSQSFSGLQSGKIYYFAVIATDTGAGSATSTSSLLQVNLSAGGQNQNQFTESVVVGQLDQYFNYNSMAVQIDASQATPLTAGQPVKMVDSAGGVPKVVACAANSDNVLGFINYNVKDAAYAAGAMCQISLAGNVIYLVAVGAIARGAQVQVDLSYIGGVKTKTGSSGASIVGWAVDKATAAGQLIRVHVSTPSFAVA